VLYLAESYLPGCPALADLASRARAGAEQAGRAGARVRFLQVILVPQDETCFAIYQAQSAQQVTEAGRLAGLAFDRVVAAQCTWTAGP
jgi:hypothetical protein